MAKRFTDTDKWKRDWFGLLPPIGKLLWVYALDECDATGIWNANFKRVSGDLDHSITAQDVETWFGTKMSKLEEGKYFIPSFVTFQYGSLNAKNAAHRGIMKKVIAATKGLPLSEAGQELIESFKTLLESQGTLPRPSTEGSETPQVKEEVKVKVKEESLGEGGAGETKPDPIDLPVLIAAWGKTLARYRINKKPELDQGNILRLAKAHGHEKTRLALIGAGFEPKSESYDPAKFCNIMRLVSDPKIFEKFVNLGAQDRSTSAQAGPGAQSKAIDTSWLDDPALAPPRDVSELMGGIMKTLKGGGA